MRDFISELNNTAHWLPAVLLTAAKPDPEAVAVAASRHSGSDVSMTHSNHGHH